MASKAVKDYLILTCWERFMAEFQWQNFLPDHNCPGLFHRAQCGYAVWYLVWRLVGAVFTISMIPISVYIYAFHVPQETLHTWAIYCSNWALVILAISATMNLVFSVYAYYKRTGVTNEKGPMPIYSKIFWVISNASNSAGVHVSLSYWIIIHDYNKDFDTLHFLSHGVNVIYIVVNLVITAMPVRLLHFHHGAVFILIYMVFNVIYVTSGGTDQHGNAYIYANMEWSSSPWQSAGLAVAAVMAVILAHTILYLIYLCRINIIRLACSALKKRWNY